MSTVRRARTPRTALYRIGHRPDPLAWPPWEYVGSGRFDDPAGEFRVLYATAQRRTAFLETLARFRPSLDVIAVLQAVENTNEPLPMLHVPVDRCHARAVGRLRLVPRQQWLDLRSFDTRETLRRELAQTLLVLGLADLDLRGASGRNDSSLKPSPTGPMTVAMPDLSTAAGLTPLSPVGPFLKGPCSSAGSPEPILPNDPDLIWAAQRFGLDV